MVILEITEQALITMIMLLLVLFQTIIKPKIIDQDTLIDGFCDGNYNIHIQDANGCEGWVVVGGSLLPMLEKVI